MATDEYRAMRPSGALAVGAVFLAPAAATALGLAYPGAGAEIAAPLYMLAVVAAAAAGGLWSGLAAAVVSFVGLNFFFTPPKHTLDVAKVEDVVALAVFLVVASIVGALLARALEERARAQRKENETRLLNVLTTRLLSGEPLEEILDAFAHTLIRLFGLVRCEIRAEIGGNPLTVTASRPGASSSEEGTRVTVPLSAGPTPFGSLTVVRDLGGGDLGEDDRNLLEAFAAQTALALERARLDAAARGARIDAEASQARAALFSSVTHDLRTPLASIKAATTGLLDSDVSYDAEQRADLLGTVIEETDRLNRLVGNLLDLARVRAGGLVPAAAPTPIEDVVESVLGRMRRALEPFRVHTMIRAGLPTALIDPVQIDQVVTNLLENAIRFSPPGGEIQISIAPWRSGLQVRIADQGPGIPPEERDRVFEEFYRRDAGPGRGGTGLGLAIARAIVGAHGGRIWIEGAPTGGAAVVFEVPAAAPAPETREPDAEFHGKEPA